MTRIIRPKDISGKTGLSRATIWRMEARGDFPSRRQVGQNAVGWISSEIEDWLESRPVVLGNRERGQKRNVGGE